MFKLIKHAGRNFQLLLSCICRNSSHLVRHLDDDRILFLNTDNFTYPFKVQSVPHSVHQSPTLEEFIFRDLILFHVFRNVSHVGFQQIVQSLLVHGKVVLALLMTFLFHGIFPILQHPFPQVIVSIVAILKLFFIKGSVETILIVFLIYLLQQCTPTVPFSDIRPILCLAYTTDFRLVSLQIELFSLETCPNEQQCTVVENPCANLICQYHYFGYRIFHQRNQVT